MSDRVGGTGFKWNTLNAFSNYYNSAAAGPPFTFDTTRLLSDTQQRSLKYLMKPGFWVQERVTDTEHARVTKGGVSSLLWLAEGYPDVAAYPLFGLLEGPGDNHDPESTSGGGFYVAGVGIDMNGKLQMYDYQSAQGSPGDTAVGTDPIILDCIAIRTGGGPTVWNWDIWGRAREYDTGNQIGSLVGPISITNAWDYVRAYGFGAPNFSGSANTRHCWFGDALYTYDVSLDGGNPDTAAYGEAPRIPQILIPASPAGTDAEFTVHTPAGGNRWDKVNEDTPDNFTTYVQPPDDASIPNNSYGPRRFQSFKHGVSIGAADAVYGLTLRTNFYHPAPSGADIGAYFRHSGTRYIGETDVEGLNWDSGLYNFWTSFPNAHDCVPATGAHQITTGSNLNAAEIGGFGKIYKQVIFGFTIYNKPYFSSTRGVAWSEGIPTPVEPPAPSGRRRLAQVV